MDCLLNMYGLYGMFTSIVSIRVVLDHSSMGLKGVNYLYFWYVGTVFVFTSEMLARFLIRFTAIDAATIRMIQYFNEVCSGLTVTVGWYLYLSFFLIFYVGLSYWIVNAMLISTIGYDLYCFFAHPERTEDLVVKNCAVLFCSHIFIISWCTNPVTAFVGALCGLMALGMASWILFDVSIPVGRIQPALVTRPRRSGLILLEMGAASLMFSHHIKELKIKH